MSIDSIVDRVGGDPGYIKFLISERHAIRSALEARGVCFDDEARSLAYPNSIGNSLHLDLIQIEAWIGTMPRQDKRLIETWSSRQSIPPAYGESKTGRINTLIRSYIDAQKETPERQGNHGGPGPGVPVREVRGVEADGSDQAGRGFSIVVPQERHSDSQHG